MTQADVRIPAEIAAHLVDPVVYGSDKLHETYTWLRANNPFGLAEPEGFDPFWVVTKHADILEISRQNELFRSGERQTTLVDKKGDAFVRKLTGGSPHLVRSLVQMDSPDHIKYRLLTQSWFMPPNLKKVEDRVRTIAKGAVQKFLATGGTCEFVADVALGYPLHVVMDILGVPPQDEDRMLRLTQELFGASDPEQQRMMVDLMDPEQVVLMLQATMM